MSPKIEYQSKRNEIFKLEYHSKGNVNQIGMSLKFYCLSNLKVNKIRMSLKLDCHINWNVTQMGMSLKL